MTNSSEKAFYDRLEVEHLAWLAKFDGRYANAWKRTRNGDFEAAMCEAAVRRILSNQNVAVEPNDAGGSSSQPDYRCHVGAKEFFVEAKCITYEAAARETGLSDDGHSTWRPSPLNPAVFDACVNKAKQCGNRGAPVLLAIGTFHSAAAMFSFAPPYLDMILTGRTTMTVTINRETCQSVGGVEQSTNMQHSAFLRPEREDSIGFARSSLSALLLCGLSLDGWVFGALHPNPANPFDAALLPRVHFRKVEVNHETGELRLSSA